MYDWLIVGAGFAGSVLAERLATQKNAKILLIDKRSHIGGNAYDEFNGDGIMVHRYGPHIFHTNSKFILDYLSQFTAWRPYEHRVLAHVDGQQVPIPINLDTVNLLYNLELTPAQLEEWFAAQAEPVSPILNSEDVVVSQVGRDLFEKFFEGYTTKQWGVPPSALDPSVTSRIPVRTNRDDRYFTDTHQCMPLHGFSAMFEKMLAHPNITISLSTDYKDLPTSIKYRKIIYTGPIDEYFDHRYGRLPYRSLQFHHVTVRTGWHQRVAVVNYPQTERYTRITEYKHLTGQTHPYTSLTYEYPCSDGDPYYPIPAAANQALYKRYEALAAKTKDVMFLGRLGSYRYYNMDQVVGQALAAFKNIGLSQATERAVSSLV